MTDLALSVRDEGEAELAFRLGAALVARGGPVSGVVTLQSASGRALLLAVSAGPGDAAAADGDESDGLIAVAPAGRRLFSVFGFPELARLAAGARARGVAFACGGALEEADVPRLMPLAPDVLLFDEAARSRDGRLDPARCDSLRRALVAPHAAEGGEALARPGASDTIFVRGYEVSLPVGAYRYEEEGRQRVRFDVEVDLHPAAPAGDGIASVFSYDRILDAIDALAAGPHVAFVETLAERLAEEVLADRRARSVRVRIEKLDLGRGTAGIDIRRSR